MPSRDPSFGTAESQAVIDAQAAQPGDVIEELRTKYDQLTQSQKRIAEAIVEDPQFVAFATVDKLANRLGVSPSTIVRFAYRLGIDGYNDLQERVRTIIRSQLRGGAPEAPADGQAAQPKGTHGVFRDSLTCWPTRTWQPMRST
jgi:DNA-binding MurR/RpiR family transcriptional regulator